MNTPLELLKKHLTVLSQAETNPETAQRLIDEIHQVFEGITQVSGQGGGMNFQHLAAVPTAKGMALGVSHAAQCLLDYRRTVAFLRGILAAIGQQLEAAPDQPVRIFYAGCGPYAPWLTLIAPLFTPEQVQVSLLEINGPALESAQHLARTLGLAGYVQEWVMADAITYQVPHPHQYQILISETLDAVLHRESYVAILWNLLPQFSEEVMLLPENVQLHLNLLLLPEGKGPNDPLEEQYAGLLFDTRQALAALPKGQALPEAFPASTVRLTPQVPCRGLQINTRVQVYEKIALQRGESSLTLPANLGLPPTPHPQDLVFTYLTQPQMELNLQVHAVPGAPAE